MSWVHLTCCLQGCQGLEHVEFYMHAPSVLTVAEGQLYCFPFGYEMMITWRACKICIYYFILYEQVVNCHS